MKKNITDTIAPGLKKLAGRITKDIENAAGVAGLAVIDDTLNQAPKPPKKTGFLRGSWFVYVNGNKKSKGSKAKDLPERIQANPSTVSITVGLSAPYAAAQHQNLTPEGNWWPNLESDDGSIGGNFLGAKLDRYKDRYAKIFADRLAKAIMGGQ